MAQPLEELRNVRLEKLKKLSALKVGGYPQPVVEAVPISRARGLELESTVQVVGRLRSLRSHGGSAFADLEDASGKIQIFLSQEILGRENYSQFELLDIGDFVLFNGTLFKTAAGELSVKATSFKLLTKSLLPLPSSFYGLKDVEERYRLRYLDLLVNEGSRKRFQTRSEVVTALRLFLDKAGFLEVETPVLQSLYGGATAKPFTTHHNALGSDFYLRISDELYLKRLMVGGLEKVYELGKDFRNEGLDREHNPEFTMLEFYWAYATYEKLMEFTEKMLLSVVENVFGVQELEFEKQLIKFNPPWPRITFRDAIIKYSGLDIEKENTFEKLLAFVKDKEIKLDLKGVVGLAPLLDTLYKKLVRPHLIGPLFLIDHPYQMKPLAKRKESDPSKAASFQLLIAGREIVNAYNELNDPREQRKRWEEEMALASKGLLEFQVVDEDYLRALEYGMPPTAGWGMGIDRFVSVLTNQHSIKDVILFPTLKPEGTPVALRHSELVSESPTPSVIANEVKQSEIATGRTPRNDDELGNKIPLEPSGNFPSREKVLGFVKEKTKNENLFRHMLAVEAAMKALAREFGGNQELWGILGLIHDADWEETKSDLSLHTRVTLDWLAGQGFNDGPLVQSLKSHNRKHTQLGELESIMEWALECCDELTGFIVSVVLVRPEKKLSSVTVDNVLKKWKEKSFAAAVDRTQIAQCEERLGIKLEEFIDLVLEAMRSISGEIGL